MDRISSRGLHAVAWIALASAPGIATAAAADYYLKLGSIKGEATAGSTGGQIEVQSWSWGASNSGSAGVGGGMGAGKVDVRDFSITRSVATGAAPKAGPKNLKLQPGGGKAQGVMGARVAAGDLDNDSREDVSADATAPLGVTKTVDKASPLLSNARSAASGSLTVAAALPGCMVGTRYADAEFGTPAGRLRLYDVIISSCATDSVTLNYARLRESPTR